MKGATVMLLLVAVVVLFLGQDWFRPKNNKGQADPKPQPKAASETGGQLPAGEPGSTDQFDEIVGAIKAGLVLVNTIVKTASSERGSAS